VSKFHLSSSIIHPLFSRNKRGKYWLPSRLRPYNLVPGILSVFSPRHISQGGAKMLATWPGPSQQHGEIIVRLRGLSQVCRRLAGSQAKSLVFGKSTLAKLYTVKVMIQTIDLWIFVLRKANHIHAVVKFLTYSSSNWTCKVLSIIQSRETSCTTPHQPIKNLNWS
jgi:hypothetical protein